MKVEFATLDQKIFLAAERKARAVFAGSHFAWSFNHDSLASIFCQPDISLLA
jgi:hypothetical protein